MSKKSLELFERSKKIAPGGVHSPVRAFKGVGGVPRFIRKARGSELVDVDDVHYTDYCMSWGPLILGHRDEDVLSAVEQALQRGWSYGAAEPYSLELAELITKQIPWVQKIRFVNSGTEAVMAALRVARAATGRTKIVKFEGCYHGHVDSMLVKAGSGLAEMASPDSAGVSSSTATETIVLPLNDPSVLEKAFSIHGQEIAAVIVEPVPANNGLLIQKPDFLHSLYALTRQSKSLLIFDEVITGFRVAFGGMAEVTGIKPDLVTYGKIIGGGFPVGAYGGREDLMNLVAPSGPVYQAGTLSANPIAMTAGLATLKKLLKTDPYSKLAARLQLLKDKLQNSTAASVLSVQSFASIFWLVIGQPSSTDHTVRSITDIPEKQKTIFPKLFHFLLSKGIYLSPSGYEVSFLSTAHSDSDILNLAEAVQLAAKAGIFES